MNGDRVTANLPGKDFDRTEAFYAALGFKTNFKDDGWMILERGPLVIEFFPHPEVDQWTSWFSACIRVDNLDALYADFQKARLSTDHKAIPRLTPPFKRGSVPRMFALVDCDGSLIRCLENGT